MSRTSPVLALEPIPLPRTRNVAAVGRLTGMYFAIRGAVSLFGVRLLHLEPSVASAFGLAFGPFLLLILLFHSLSANSRWDTSAWRSNSTIRWLAAYLAFAGASLLWGIAASPLSSLVYWLALLLDVATVLLLLTLYSTQDTVEHIFDGYITGACLVALLAWLMPAQGDLRLGDQDFFNTNQIANVCAFGIFFSQLLRRFQARRSWLPILFLTLTLLRSLSKTTLAAFLLAEAVLLFRDRNISRRTRRRVLLGSVVVLLIALPLFVSYYDIYTNAGNQAETLTGRTAIWAWACDRVPESPWIGHGFDSMWKIMPPFGIDRFEARHAENELLQQIYAYGIIGAALCAAIYFSLYRSFRRAPHPGVRPILGAFLLFILIRGLAEAEPFDLLLPCWAICLLAALAVTPTQRM